MDGQRQCRIKIATIPAMKARSITKLTATRAVMEAAIWRLIRFVLGKKAAFKQKLIHTSSESLNRHQPDCQSYYYWSCPLIFYPHIPDHHRSHQKMPTDVIFHHILHGKPFLLIVAALIGLPPPKFSQGLKHTLSPGHQRMWRQLLLHLPYLSFQFCGHSPPRQLGNHS